MVRLRKTYGSLMVDMRITNDKLSDRAQRIVAQAAGVERTAAKAALRAADDEVKVAITMLVSGIGPDEARDRLRRAGGDLRRALEENACA
jgi:N-acetylmuramic acid 6-phosphate etherase